VSEREEGDRHAGSNRVEDAGEGCCRRGGIGRRPRSIARADDDVEKPRGEVSGDDERIAAVVARSGQNEHARSTVGQHVTGNGRSRESGTFHQRLAGRLHLDGADVRDATDRLEKHRLIISTVSSSRAANKRASHSGLTIRHRLYQSIH